MTVDIVILSAGASSRLGSAKQQVRLFAEPLLLRACKLAQEFAHLSDAPHPPLLVVGPYAREDRQILTNSHACEVVENTRWQDGLLASLACAVNARRSSDALLVLLVDQYRVQIQDLQSLFTLWQQTPEKPVAAAYQATVGPPVIWPSRYFSQLSQLEVSAKSLLLSVPYLAVDLPRAAIDLDTPTDLERLREYERACMLHTTSSDSKP